jgi:hypothetical protein
MSTERQTRYNVVNRSLLRAEWTSHAGATVATTVDLLDISRSGAKILLDGSPGMGAALTIHFDGFAAAPAKVCWAREGDHGRCWLACAFDPLLPEGVLEGLLKRGYLERRRDPREQVTIPAMARWPMGDPVRVDVRDFSGGGLCLTAPYAAKKGQRLLLHLGDGEKAQGNALVEVQWCIQFDEGHLIGCSFLHREGQSAVRRMAHSTQPKPDDEPSHRAKGVRARLADLKAAWKSLAAWADVDR